MIKGDLNEPMYASQVLLIDARKASGKSPMNVHCYDLLDIHQT